MHSHGSSVVFAGNPALKAPSFPDFFPLQTCGSLSALLQRPRLSSLLAADLTRSSVKSQFIAAWLAGLWRRCLAPAQRASSCTECQKEKSEWPFKASAQGRAV